jgi:hypothetical protein
MSWWRRLCFALCKAPHASCIDTFRLLMLSFGCVQERLVLRALARRRFKAYPAHLAGHEIARLPRLRELVLDCVECPHGESSTISLSFHFTLPEHLTEADICQEKGQENGVPSLYLVTYLDQKASPFRLDLSFQWGLKPLAQFAWTSLGQVLHLLRVGPLSFCTLVAWIEGETSGGKFVHVAGLQSASLERLELVNTCLQNVFTVIGPGCPPRLASILVQQRSHGRSHSPDTDLARM